MPSYESLIFNRSKLLNFSVSAWSPKTGSHPHLALTLDGSQPAGCLDDLFRTHHLVELIQKARLFWFDVNVTRLAA